jgi:pyruvate kinase
VANAVLDGTDAVMLSAETAAGKYPVKAVQAMSEVIQGAEKYQIGALRRAARGEDDFANNEEAISMAVTYVASHMRLRAIVALTESGLTPQLMSRSRSDIPIYAFTRHEGTRRRVTLYRGVYAVPFDIPSTDPKLLYPAIFERLLELGLVETGDQVLLTKGELSGVSGGTNSLQILSVARS